jgi:hypothetical protein
VRFTNNPVIRNAFLSDILTDSRDGPVTDRRVVCVAYLSETAGAGVPGLIEAACIDG